MALVAYQAIVGNCWEFLLKITFLSFGRQESSPNPVEGAIFQRKVGIQCGLNDSSRWSVIYPKCSMYQ